MRLDSPNEVGTERCTSCNSCCAAVITTNKLPFAKFCSQGCLNDFLRRLA